MRGRKWEGRNGLRGGGEGEEGGGASEAAMSEESRVSNQAYVISLELLKSLLSMPSQLLTEVLVNNTPPSPVVVPREEYLEPRFVHGRKLLDVLPAPSYLLPVGVNGLVEVHAN